MVATPGSIELPLHIDHSALGDSLDQLLSYAEQAHAVFLDATRGWSEHGQTLTNTVTRIAQRENKSVEEGFKRPFIHRIGAETYTETVAGIMERIQPRGSNEKFLARMLLVSLYSVWETRTRNAMAKACGVSARDVVWSVFGDLRNIRHAILHNQSIADERVAKAESCQWFALGEEIVIQRGHLVAVMKQIRQLRDRIRLIPDRNRGQS